MDTPNEPATEPNALPEPLAYSVAQTAHALGVTTRTVERLISTGDLRSFKIGRCRKIEVADLRAYIAAQKSRRAAA